MLSIISIRYSMKYLCRTCKTVCKDMIEHVKKDHKFSDKQIERSLETNPDSFKNGFEEIK